MSQPVSYKQQVREQYEALPYPPRNPDKELETLCVTWTDRLDYLNYRFFGGRHDFNDFRVLVAGDGTGDASTFLGEQLVDTSAEIIALDLSDASQAIARARSQKRGLSNIRYVHASLLDLPALELGHFDLITCGGVLHHLEDPDAGLAALKSVLKPGGVMSLMVYGKIARTGVYYMQEFLRLLLPDAMSRQDKLALTGGVLRNVPKSNWFTHNAQNFALDIQLYGDNGIYDLLLHSQDRGYTVSDIYDWLDRTGLHLAEFNPMGSGENYMYNPLYQMRDLAVCEQLKTLSKRDQQQACELLLGNITRHFFFATASETYETVSIDDENAIPFHLSTSAVHETGLGAAFESLAATEPGQYANFHQPRYQARCVFVKREHTADLLRVIDGKRNMRDIVRMVAAQQDKAGDETAEAALLVQLKQLVTEWRHAGLMALRYKEAKVIPPVPQLRSRAQERCGLSAPLHFDFG